jgi:hypothetical protein
MFGFEDLLRNLQQGTLAFLGLLCFLVFALNAVLLIWLLVRKSQHGLMRCPRCGRTVACPHCADEDQPASSPAAGQP